MAEESMKKTVKKDMNKAKSMLKGKKGGTSKMAVGAAGAFAGAALGSVAAIALSDKNFRKKVGTMMNEFPEKATKTLDKLEQQTNTISREAKQRLEQGKRIARSAEDETESQ